MASSQLLSRVTVTVMLGATTFVGVDAAGTRASFRNERYVANGTADQVLDLDTPETPGFATVMFIHGGSLQESGERRSSSIYAKVCQPFLASGIACATIDYRLAPTHKWPAMPRDVAAAFTWVRDKVTSIKGDPSRIFLFGHSSGCHLAAVLGANPKYLSAVGHAPADIAGIIAMGCVLSPLEEATSRLTMDEIRARWANSGDTATFASLEDRLDSDPSRFLGAHMPPTLVVLAEAERFFPAILEQGAKFARRLLELKRPADVVIVPGGHMTSIGALHQPSDPTFTAIRRFIGNPSRAGSDH